MPRPRSPTDSDCAVPRLTTQSGVALIMLLVLLAIILVAFVVAGAPEAGTETEQEQQTIHALSIAREALIAYAVSVQPDSSAKRPGDLPCPDLDNDGNAETTCSSPSSRIGRLPVETLELQDLVDGHGERLWYALSSTFDRSTVNQCPVPGGPNCLNSDTGGTITVRSPAGVIINDGTSVPGAAIAVIFSAGPTITRQDGVSQDRGCTGDANVALCQASGKCSDKLGTTARCNPVNYLDAVSGGGLPSEDNRDFVDSDTTNGFIEGPIRGPTGNLIVNDRLLVLRHADLMPRLEQRVAREALRCLKDYAFVPHRYPWAAPIASDYTLPLADSATVRFGRLAQTLSASNSSDPALPGYWPRACPISVDAIDPAWTVPPVTAAEIAAKQWWANWSNLVFYGVATDYAPNGTAVCGSCLAVDPPGTANKAVVVLVAGRALAGQTRGTGSAALNYLEGGNEAGAGGLFKRAAVSPTFNDVVVF